MLKTVVKRRGELTTPKNLIIAAIAGVINVYVTCPLWVVCKLKKNFKKI
jgi:hypothetical protein